MMTADSQICIRGSLIFLLRRTRRGMPWGGDPRNSPLAKEDRSQKIGFLLLRQQRIHNSLPWNHRIGSTLSRPTPHNNPPRPSFPASVPQITNLPPNLNHNRSNNSLSPSLHNRHKMTRALRGVTVMGNGCLSSEIVVMDISLTYPLWGICMPVE